jgi:7,8-dihydroneopterin aldolase/epimerase/oxygenase
MFVLGPKWLMRGDSFRLFVSDVEFYAYHGATSEEQFIGHRYRLDLDMRVRGNAPETDGLEGTVDYGVLTDLAVQLAREPQVKLMETVAQRVGIGLMEANASIVVLTVTIAKIAPPVPHVAGSAGVSITFSR